MFVNTPRNAAGSHVWGAERHPDAQQISVTGIRRRHREF
jgi:hypothetical protein